jgi:hypothetical protein
MQNGALHAPPALFRQPVEILILAKHFFYAKMTARPTISTYHDELLQPLVR